MTVPLLYRIPVTWNWMINDGGFLSICCDFESDPIFADWG
jgi:hypothetical protein